MIKKNLKSETLIKIPFYDVDQMRCAWHGNYIKYFERARCDLLDKVGYGYAEMERSGYSWPIIDVRVKYVKPALFDHTIRVCAELVEYEHCIKIKYVIRAVETDERLTKGYSVQVAVDIKSGEMCYTSPPVFLEKLSCHDYI